MCCQLHAHICMLRKRAANCITRLCTEACNHLRAWKLLAWLGSMRTRGGMYLFVGQPAEEGHFGGDHFVDGQKVVGA